MQFQDNSLILASYADCLARLGFAQDEIDVYLACLLSGETTATVISKVSGLKRPTTYLVIERLIKKQALTARLLGHKQVVRALPPEALMELKRQPLVQMESLLPSLQILLAGTSKIPTLRSLVGRAGIEQFYSEAYLSNTETLTWIDDSLCSGVDTPSPWLNSKYAIAKLEKPSRRTRRARKRISAGNWIRGLVPYEPDDNVLKKNGLLRYQYEFLHYKKFGLRGELRDFVMVPRSGFSLPCEITIYGDNVAIVSYTAAHVSIVTSSLFASSMRTIFTLAFEAAKLREPEILSKKHLDFLSS